MEWTGVEQKKTFLKVFIYTNGRIESSILAECHFHGDWITWPLNEQ